MKKNLFSPIAVMIILTVLFGVSLWVRLPYAGVYKDTEHQALTGSTVKFAKNWYREGIVALNFAMYESPASCETLNLQDRGLYYSYPPGTVVPIWLFAKILNTEPSPLMVRIWNMLNQFWVSLFLAFTAWNLMRGSENKKRFYAALGTGISYLFFERIFYYHLASYFSDQAVILWVAMLAWLESLYDVRGYRTSLEKFAVAFAVFWGTLIDPLMPIVAGCLFLRRMLCQKNADARKRRWLANFTELLLPVFVSVGLFALQLFATGGINKIFHKFAARSLNLTYRASIFEMVGRFGIYDALLIAVTLLLLSYFLLKSSEGRALIFKRYSLIFFLSLAFFGQLLVFLNHTIVHPFSFMKLLLLFSLLYGIALGLLSWFSSKLFWGVVLFSALIFWKDTHNVLGLFKGSPYLLFNDVAVSIGKTSGYDDIYFSPSIVLPQNPAMLLSLSMKHVRSLEEADVILGQISKEKGARIHLLYHTETELPPRLKELALAKQPLGIFTDYIFSPENFKTVWDEKLVKRTENIVYYMQDEETRSLALNKISSFSKEEIESADPELLFRSGKIYDLHAVDVYTDIVSKDSAVALQWYTRAVAKGHKAALRFMVRAYLRGWGTPDGKPNYPAAIKSYLQSML